jgi:uncharacterized protein YjlB
MQTEEIRFGPSEWVPNNSTLPVLLYRNALPEATAEKFEGVFAGNGWQGIWRNGVFHYQHYHTGAHEVLGVAGGEATLLIGGPGGRQLAVSRGDCIVLPAGTGHQNLGASPDFLVIGAYPPGQYADIQTSAASHKQLATITGLPLPPNDPIEGRDGSLIRSWQQGNTPNNSRVRG